MGFGSDLNKRKNRDSVLMEEKIIFLIFFDKIICLILHCTRGKLIHTVVSFGNAVLFRLALSLGCFMLLSTVFLF